MHKVRMGILLLAVLLLLVISASAAHATQGQHTAGLSLTQWIGAGILLLVLGLLGVAIDTANGRAEGLTGGKAEK